MAEKLKRDNRGAERLRLVKLNQYEIAEVLTADSGGDPLHQSSVSRWRSGEGKPSFKWRMRLKKRFRIGLCLWDEEVAVSVREIRTASV